MQIFAVELWQNDFCRLLTCGLLEDFVFAPDVVGLLHRHAHGALVDMSQHMQLLSRVNHIRLGPAFHEVNIGSPQRERTKRESNVFYGFFEGLFALGTCLVVLVQWFVQAHCVDERSGKIGEVQLPQVYASAFGKTLLECFFCLFNFTSLHVIFNQVFPESSGARKLVCNALVRFKNRHITSTALLNLFVIYNPGADVPAIS
mmetsp:Transcript_18230/g.31644  ORF Transcript_18230/g.31644 Transcript_18230/m.31644 type:complete len:202 (-) Transcript_18230:340-945(-)